jgi:hypothetical protein
MVSLPGVLDLRAEVWPIFQTGEFNVYRELEACETELWARSYVHL